MTNIVIAGYARSAFTLAHKGALRKTRPDDLAAAVIKGLVERTKVNPADIEDVALGCAFRISSSAACDRNTGLPVGVASSVAA